MTALKELQADNARLREGLRSRGLSDDELAFAAAENDLDAALTANEKLFYCVRQLGRRPAKPQPMNSSPNDRIALRDDLYQQAAEMRAKLAATIGCTRPVPALSQDPEADLQKLSAFITDCRGDMASTAFAAATAMAGRIPTGAEASTPGQNSVTAAAQTALVALSRISPDQARLLSEFQAVEKDTVERAKFIRAHEADLLSLANALQRTGPVAQAEPDAARPAAATSDALIAQYEVVQADPIARAQFLRTHESAIRCWLVRNSTSSN